MKNVVYFCSVISHNDIVIWGVFLMLFGIGRFITVLGIIHQASHPAACLPVAGHRSTWSYWTMFGKQTRVLGHRLYTVPRVTTVKAWWTMQQLVFISDIFSSAKLHYVTLLLSIVKLLSIVLPDHRDTCKKRKGSWSGSRYPSKIYYRIHPG